MLNTKNMLMLVVLSGGLLTVLTGTAVSQIQPVFADKDEEECKDNGDFNGNKETQKIHQENNCMVVNENENDDKSDENSNGGSSNGDITCWNFGQNPEDGDAIVDEDVFDPIFGPIG
ncbi:MAG TPA: hypothetical protein VJ599_09105 [Nitrososphaeraceae archaeon]|nr:hypothetical protein [Nitrososphaeraceae archaeon]